MTKKATILFLLAGVLLLWAVMDGLRSSAGRAATESVRRDPLTVQAGIDELVHASAAYIPRPETTAFLRAIHAEWTRDPFPQEITGPMPLLAVPSQDAHQHLVYSGFLRAGERSGAFISGVHYQEGAVIDHSTLRVKRITDHSVTLEDIQSGHTRILPIKEHDQRIELK